MCKVNFVILLLCGCLTATAQGNLKFSTYSVNEGLPQSSVWSITQDKNGFLWVSTSDGVCRFDGFTFNVYKSNPKNPHSILTGNENYFFNDEQHNLWLISAKGISRYNDAKDNFDNIFINKKAIENQYYPKNFIYGKQDGYIWAGMAKNGFIKINTANNTAKTITNAGKFNLSNNTFWSKGFMEKDCIYGINDSGFFKYNVTTNTISHVTQKGNSVTLCNLNENEVLSCTSFFLYFINKKTLKVRAVPLNLPKDVQLVTDIERNWEDSSQVILATPMGILYVDIATGKLVNALTDFDPGKQNKYSYAECFYHDNSGNFWVGLNGDGLRKISYPFKKFKLYKTSNTKSSIVKSLYANKEKVYVGYFNNGMDIFSRKNEFERNLNVSKMAGIANNNIYGIFPINATDLLLYVFGEEQNVFLRYSTLSNSFTNITPPFQKLFSFIPLLKNSLFCFTQKADGTFIGASHSYIFSLKFDHKKIPELKFVYQLPNQDINCLYRETDNDYWVGTQTGLFHIKNGKPQAIPLDKLFLIKTIEKDNEGNIWVGGTEGLYILDKNYAIKKIYTESNGLLNQHIYGILKDSIGNMWFSTNKGLGVYYVKEKKFRFFTKEDGLQANEFNSKAFFKASDNELFFGGINGTNSFYANEIKNNPNTPPVIINSIKLFDEPYKTDSAYWKVKSLTLPYTDNSLSFEFVMPEFTNSSQNQYSYMMEGVDKNWIFSGDKRFARYPSLTPGHYTFKVKASNDDGIWGNAITTISIEIVPPFWQRWWFIFLTILLFILLLIFTVVFIQKQQFKKKMKALEVQHKIQIERERISRDLHDNVGTQLSLISKSIQGIMDDSTNISEEDKKKKLASTGQSSVEVITALRETIWALNKEAVLLEDFFDRLKSFAQKQSALSPETEVQFKEAIDNETVTLSPTEALNLFRICQEAITNALKYSNASIIEIEMKTHQNKFILTISDNGSGFDSNKINTNLHYGIENMKHRAIEINCELLIESKKNEGTTITISQ